MKLLKSTLQIGAVAIFLSAIGVEQLSGEWFVALASLSAAFALQDA